MSPVDQMTTAKTRVLALAIAALAMLATGSFVADGAGAAGSGGIGDATSSPTGGSGDGDGDRSTNATGAKYKGLWSRTSARDRRWAHRTAKCESGGDPDAIGGGGRYRGAFQFMRATWKSSPKSPGGDPIDYSYRTQAVVAVKLKHRDGADHWPVCG